MNRRRVNVPSNQWPLQIFRPLRSFGLFDNSSTFWRLFDWLANNTTTNINPIKFNHNLGRASWWVCWWARHEPRGECFTAITTNPDSALPGSCCRLSTTWSLQHRGKWYSYCGRVKSTCLRAGRWAGGR